MDIFSNRTRDLTSKHFYCGEMLCEFCNTVERLIFFCKFKITQQSKNKIHWNLSFIIFRKLNLLLRLLHNVSNSGFNRSWG